MSLFFGVPVDLAYHLVCWIAAILAPLTGGLATAAAIIAFTVLARLLMLPLSYFAVRGSVRGEGARARLQPKIAELRRRHAKDPQRLQAELGMLYRAEGSGMFGGFLPLLIQLPFFSVMYRLFLDHSVGGAPNTLLTHTLLAAPLGSHWLAGAGPLSAQGAVFAGLFALMAVVAVLAVRAARRAASAVPPVPVTPAREKVPTGSTPTGSTPAGSARPVSATRDRATSPPQRAPPRRAPPRRATGRPPPPRRPRPTRRPRGQLRDLDYPVRIAGDGRDRAAGRRAVPAHHDGLDAGRADRAAPPLYFRNGTTVRRCPDAVSLMSCPPGRRPR